MQKIEWNAGSLSLIGANFFPLAGALFFGWPLSGIIFLYWMENVVIGIFNIARMTRSTAAVSPPNTFRMNGRPYVPGMKRLLIFFFILHYGLFTLIHGVFVSVAFGQPEIGALDFLVAFGSLFVSHGISYQSNFIGQKEYERISAPELFIHPYKRIIVLHLTVLVGGMLAQLISVPLVAAVFLICLKTAVDLAIHLWEHRKFASLAPVA
ncbi:MAG: DUF6498-containing protein [Candidatus Moraniibacteriota bacterium]